MSCQHPNNANQFDAEVRSPFRGLSLSVTSACLEDQPRVGLRSGAMAWRATPIFSATSMDTLLGLT